MSELATKFLISGLWNVEFPSENVSEELALLITRQRLMHKANRAQHTGNEDTGSGQKKCDLGVGTIVVELMFLHLHNGD